MTWQWFVAQGFALISLVFLVISYQQKTTKKLIIFRNIGTGISFIGLCFLGEVSAIIMCGVGALRNLVGLFFAYKPNTKNYVKIIAGVVLGLLLITLNIIFWKNWLNIFSIALGLLLIVTFLQTKANVIRFLSIFVGILSITYYALLWSPVNIIIETFAFVSAIVGIIRIDLKKGKKEVQTDEKQEILPNEQEILKEKEQEN